MEEQITGAADHGGVQIAVYPMKAERYVKMRTEKLAEERMLSVCHDLSMDMALAPGGRMKQEIYDDPYGLDAWDQRHSSRCFVSIANSAVWTAITGERPPNEPPTAKEYTNAGLPWFDYYGGDAEAIAGAQKFKSLVSVAAMGKQKGETPLPENESVNVERIIALRKRGADQVREMPVYRNDGTE